MRLSLLFVIVCCSIKSLTASIQSSGITFTLTAAEPDSYWHTSGGGSYYYSVDTLKADYYVCDSETPEYASVFLHISTDDDFSFSSYDEISIKIYSNDGLQLQGVENNCLVDDTDAEEICNGGENVEVSSSSNRLTLTGLESNVVVVIRLDYTFSCSIECGCKCNKNGNRWSGVCPSTPVSRRVHLSSSGKKRDIQALQQECETFGYDGYNVAVYLNNRYTVNNEDTFSVPLTYLTFSNLCKILVCQDYTGCYIGEIIDSDYSYKDRTCVFSRVPCDNWIQQENLNMDDSVNQQGGQSYTILPGVIAGSVIGVVAIALVIGVIIYKKKFQQVPMNEDTIEALKVPLN